MRARVIRKFHFHAAHHVPSFPDGHQCRRVHGHTFHGELVLEGEVNPQTGLAVEFAHVKTTLQKVIDVVDHQLLNDIEGLENPTTELLCDWFWKQLKPLLPQLKTIRLQETPNNIVEYDGPDA